MGIASEEVAAAVPRCARTRDGCGGGGGGSARGGGLCGGCGGRYVSSRIEPGL